jgi:hypothetical protein
MTARPPAVALTEQAMTARTADEHRAVAAAYRGYGEQLRADAAKHVKLADWWANAEAGWEIDDQTTRSRARAFRARETRHCRALADSLSQAAAEAEAIASAHEQMAGALGAR